MQDTITEHQKEMEMRIVSVAEQLIKSIGIKSVTMDSIAAEIGISKKTIYHFFEGKAQLVESVVAKLIRTKKESLQLVKVNAENALEEAFMAWNIIEDFFSSVTSEARLQLSKQYVQAHKTLSEFEQVYLYHYFKSNIESGIAAELYRASINADIISHYLAEVLLTHIHSNMVKSRRFSITEIEGQILSYHLHGIATEKGSALIEKYRMDYLAYDSPFS